MSLFTATVVRKPSAASQFLTDTEARISLIRSLAQKTEREALGAAMGAGKAIKPQGSPNAGPTMMGVGPGMGHVVPSQTTGDRTAALHKIQSVPAFSQVPQGGRLGGGIGKLG